MRGLVLGLSLCVALTGCDVPTDEEDGGIGTPQAAGLSSLFEVVPVAAGGSAVIPFPNNLLFADTTNAGGPVPGFTTDATLNIPNGSENIPGSTATPVPFVRAANRTDGFSTVDSAFTDFLGFVDFSTATTPTNAPGLVIFNAFTQALLVPGVDYELQNSPATDASGRTIQEQRTRILIEWLKPLSGSTTYMIGVTSNLRDIYGNPAQASDEFKLARSATAVSAQDPAVHPILNLLTSTQEATLESIRANVIRPTVTSFLGLYNTVHNADFPVDLTENDVINVWTFTTQSTSTTLSRLNAAAVARPLFIANTTISTGDLGLGLADTADIWAGTLAVPYYLQNQSYGATAPLTGYWKSTTFVLGTNFPPLLPTAVPCGAFAKSDSTSICRPDPDVASGSTETVPVLVAVPNGNSGQSKPANGWPVVIFQHGVTRNRTDMLALAPTLAAAGFVTIAIDHPLHGVTNNDPNIATNPFYENQIFTNPGFGGVFNALLTGERTFDIDFQDNTPDAANPCLAANNLPDGVIDSSGAWYVNLSSLTTSRDNLRQSVSDIINLTKSIVNLDLDQAAGAPVASDIDETRIFFVGQSLGAITGTTALAVNTDIGAASLNVPGGGISRLLDASVSFGPRIAAGLACSGVVEGTDSYESFIRFAQHMIDPVDPINFAVAANTNHRIHLIEVIGDTVVPNAAPATGTTAANHFNLIEGRLSGTDALIERMGLPIVGPITPPAECANNTDGAGLDVAVQFQIGTHGSLLTPAGPGGATQFLAVTTEMQRETATFLASNGLTLASGSCP